MSSVCVLIARMLRIKNAPTDPVVPQHDQIAPVLLLRFGVDCSTLPAFRWPRNLALGLSAEPVQMDFLALGVGDFCIASVIRLLRLPIAIFFRGRRRVKARSHTAMGRYKVCPHR